MVSLLRNVLVSIVVVALSACGGGGGGGDGAGGAGDARQDGGAEPAPLIAVSLNVPSIQATAFQNQKFETNSFTNPSIRILAQVTGPVPDDVVVVVRDTGQGFAGAPIELAWAGLHAYEAILRPNVALPPGVYKGELQVHLCKDAACSQEYGISGGTIPYELTMLAQLEATVLVNGTQVGTVRSGHVPLTVSMADGGTLEIRTNVPVEMIFSSGPGLVAVNVDPGSSSTVWRAVLARPDRSSGNTVRLSGVVQEGPLGMQMGAAIDVTLVP